MQTGFVVQSDVICSGCRERIITMEDLHKKIRDLSQELETVKREVISIQEDNEELEDNCSNLYEKNEVLEEKSCRLTDLIKYRSMNPAEKGMAGEKRVEQLIYNSTTRKCLITSTRMKIRQMDLHLNYEDRALIAFEVKLHVNNIEGDDINNFIKNAIHLAKRKENSIQGAVLISLISNISGFSDSAVTRRKCPETGINLWFLNAVEFDLEPESLIQDIFSDILAGVQHTQEILPKPDSEKLIARCDIPPEYQEIFNKSEKWGPGSCDVALKIIHVCVILMKNRKFNNQN